MKSTPNQAIYDFSSAVYKLVLLGYERGNDKILKEYFLMRCLMIINELKSLDATISIRGQTIQYIVDNIKYTFWLIEAPEPNEKFKFLEYLTKELTSIFYNLDITY
ncbi:hypothetical protein ASC84_22010 [Acinetobacter sp. Root1280]|uniref:hypothetical protein n=1 Tax=Acinetobacter sp. Root1280 TaxID=1736444 RepID=UPI0007012C7D|nr:hypothetical protein [Acinetobacter sp. Root1280]KQW96053.1 hypothetical protein ASC84_22010 [Acinetobacter sp. Root1280]